MAKAVLKGIGKSPKDKDCVAARAITGDFRTAAFPAMQDLGILLFSEEEDVAGLKSWLDGHLQILKTVHDMIPTLFTAEFDPHDGAMLGFIDLLQNHSGKQITLFGVDATGFVRAVVRVLVNKIHAIVSNRYGKFQAFAEAMEQRAEGAHGWSNFKLEPELQTADEKLINDAAVISSYLKCMFPPPSRLQ